MELNTQQRVRAYLKAQAKAFNALQVRALIVSCLSGVDEDVAQKKARRGTAHWKLWMLDDAEDEPADFVAAFFGGAGITLFAGQSTADQVKSYCERRRRPSAARAIKELPSRLGAPYRPLRISKRDVEKWVGRPLEPEAAG
jgi:hypothetical protein